MNEETFEISAPRLPVVVAHPDAPEPVQFAAGELRRYLGMILGVELPLTAQPGHCRIAVEVDEEAGMAGEGFVVQMRSGGMRIAGADPAGVVFGAYAFLRQFCGCRFSSLAPDGELIPRKARLVIGPLPWRKEPLLFYRGLQFYYWESRELMVARIDWMAKNGLNYVMVAPAPDGENCVDVDPESGAEVGGEPGKEQRYSKAWLDRHLLPEIRKRGLKIDFNHHNLRFWLPPEKYFQDHPEWYALVDGERRADGKQLCLCTSNAEMVREVVENVRVFLRENPDVRVAGIIPEDHTGMCQCERCRADDDDPDDAFRPKPRNVTHAKLENRSKSRRYARLVEAVARGISDEFPGVKIGMAAYRDLIFPSPEINLPENSLCWVALHWRHAHTEISPRSPSEVNRFFAEILRRWREVFRGELILYEYYMGLVVHRSLPFPVWETICREWPILRDVGVGGATVQLFGTNHEVYGLNALAFARCGWEERVDPEEVLAEFLEGVYGAAAPAVRPLFERFAEAVREVEGRDDVALQGPPFGLGAGHGLQPTGKSVVFFLDRIGDQFARECFNEARRLAGTEREARQVAALAAAFEYWEMAAEFARRCDEAERCADEAPKRAVRLYREAVQQVSEQILPACRNLPAGWFAAGGDAWWERMAGQAQERLCGIENGSISAE
jgi:hypothetical protein